MARDAFVASLRPLRLIPARLVRPVAAVVTVIEVAVALGLGWAIVAELVELPGDRAVGLVSLVLAGLLLAGLTAGIILALRRGADARCACFGVSEQPLGARHVIRNSVLFGAVLAGLVVHGVGAGSPEVAGLVLALAGGAVVALIVIRIDDLIELFAPVRPASGVRS